MASVPPQNPPPPVFPDIFEQASEPFSLPPILDQGPTMEPIDPADVHPLPEGEIPDPRGDAPTEEDRRRDEERLYEPMEVVSNDTQQGGSDSGASVDHDEPDNDEVDHDSAEHDGSDHEGSEGGN